MANRLHRDIAGADLHPVGHEGPDPGAVGAGALWTDATDPALPVLRRRNAANDGWIVLAEGGPAIRAAVTAHLASTGNPHGVTKTQVGLGNVPDVDARPRSTHTGTQPADTLTETATAKVLTGEERTKLGGVAAGATANATDAQLRDRAGHTGTQPAATVADLAEAVRDAVGAALVPGANVTIAVDDAADTITISASGGGGSSALVVEREDAAIVNPAAVIDFAGSAFLVAAEAGGEARVGLNYGAGAGQPVQGTDARLSDARTPLAHSHPASAVTDFAEAVDDRAAALIVAGAGLAKSYDDVAGALTLAATGAPETVFVPHAVGVGVVASHASSTYFEHLGTTSVLPAGTWDVLTLFWGSYTNSLAGASAQARVGLPVSGLPMSDAASSALARFTVFAFSRGNVVSDGVATTGFRADYRVVGGGTAYALNGMIVAVCRKVG